ncbi:MAG: PaaF [Thermodesulfobacterium sp. 37_54]|uniref:Phenylacetate-coenzyme A ligase n=4 Tax=Thermodesulfobacterium commune TaxID=1741 RepID=A0A075WTU1_9BACT|nr:phenylacetate--CoA ligase [Thermodesulfobacterium commune]AIH04694.1 phenylacetate--CoA ligase [Thermodesulfobacterium commune DSM 2178]KUJ97739.1 MAG: PaaF [Thermodesulfobacterium sp. 37_54]KUK19257.1 MAG: PaaF [Thermodesulfobacterium commune]
MEVNFWDPKIETMPQQDLKALQLEKLKKVVTLVYERVPHYRKKFEEAKVKPEDIKSLEDVVRLPFTTKEDLFVDYPYGLLAVPLEEVVRLHTSSGTTGKPKALFFTKKDIDAQAELIARNLVMTGTTRGDVLQNSMTYGLFTGALVMHYGAEKLGVLVIPAGPGNTERQIELMKTFGTTCFHMTPSYALYVASVILNKGLDPRRDLKLKRAYLGAEPYTEETRKKIEELLGIDVYNCYGLSEMGGPGVGFECVYKEGLHIWEDAFLVEIVNPETGDPVKEGEIGELVLTSLNREGMPLIRYRTRDLTFFFTEPCACGRTHRRISRILGRADDMFIVRGVNIFPQQIEAVLMGIKGVAQNYQIVLENYDEMIVKVEIDREFFDGRIERLLKLKEEIVEKLREAILVKPKVELLEPGTLPVSEGKAKRVIDKRTL